MFKTLAKVLAGLLLLLIAAALIVNYAYPAQLTAFALKTERDRSSLALQSTEIDGATMPYLMGGRGPTLLLIHGFGANKDNFTRVARWLTPHYTVVIPDLLGFGEAAKPADADYLPAAQVARLRKLVAHLGLSGPLHIGGSSMGGSIAAEWALQAPQEIQSLWLLDASGTAKGLETPLRQTYLKTGKLPLLVQSVDDYPALLDAAMHRRPWLPHGVQQTLAQTAVANYPLHSRIFAALTHNPPLEQRFVSSPVPTLIVFGAQDRLINPEAAGSFARLFPQHQSLRMADIGHLPAVEAPRQSAEDYLAFRQSLAR